MQHVLTNNVTALDPGVAQYTLIQNEEGGSIDDAISIAWKKGILLWKKITSSLSMQPIKKRIGIGFSITRDGTRI